LSSYRKGDQFFSLVLVGTPSINIFLYNSPNFNLLFIISISTTPTVIDSPMFENIANILSSFIFCNLQSDPYNGLFNSKSLGSIGNPK
jgi:hypothetical protein